MRLIFRESLEVKLLLKLVRQQQKLQQQQQQLPFVFRVRHRRSTRCYCEEETPCVRSEGEGVSRLMEPADEAQWRHHQVVSNLDTFVGFLFILIVSPAPLFTKCLVMSQMGRLHRIHRKDYTLGPFFCPFQHYGRSSEDGGFKHQAKGAHFIHLQSLYCVNLLHSSKTKSNRRQVAAVERLLAASVSVFAVG